MNIFDILTLIGGLSLFLFGMNLMGQAPERKAGRLSRKPMNVKTFSLPIW